MLWQQVCVCWTISALLQSCDVKTRVWLEAEHSQASYARLGRLVDFVRLPVNFCVSKQRQPVVLIAGIRRKKMKRHKLIVFIAVLAFGVEFEKDLLLHSFTGMPSILALMSFLLLLMAERTASRRNPGHLSSFRISLQTHSCFYR